MPTAERACFPIASPKTSTIKSENPFTTLGWSLKPSAELTIPRTLTMRFTRSRLPSAVRIFPSMINPACRADWYPCSTVRSLPTFPLSGHWPPGVLPDRNSNFPVCTAFAKLAAGAESGGKVMFNSFSRASAAATVCAGAETGRAIRVSITPPTMLNAALMSRLLSRCFVDPHFLVAHGAIDHVLERQGGLAALDLARHVGDERAR